MTALSAVVLEPLRWWDLARVAALESELFAGDSPWPAEAFWAELAAGHHYVAHRRPDGTVDGYAGLGEADDDATVHTIGVDPRVQGRGIGRALLGELIATAQARRMLLEVRTDNVPAISLYESCGFARVGLRRRYYQPSGADAYTMVRPATSTAAVQVGGLG
jgi:[ribosomal protein S18]-alanine N-acetyltransferase